MKRRLTNIYIRVLSSYIDDGNVFSDHLSVLNMPGEARLFLAWRKGLNSPTSRFPLLLQVSRDIAETLPDKYGSAKKGKDISGRNPLLIYSP
jgi:hypothetical protein